MASKTLLVAQREYLENVRTKTFWIGIFIVPILIAASVGIGALLKKFKEVQRYTVVDLGNADLAKRAEREFRSGDAKVMFQLLAKAREDQAQGKVDPAVQKLAEKFQGLKPGDQPSGEQMLAMYDWMQSQPPDLLAKFAGIEASKKFDYVPLEKLGVTETDEEAREKHLNTLLNDGKLFAYVILGKDPVNKLDDFRYICNNQADGSLQNAYQNTLTDLVQKDRIRAAGIDQKVAEHIQERVQLTRKKAGEDGRTADVEEKDVANQWAPMGFVYFLWIAIFSIANLLLTNTIEEKSNRIIEVLLSSVSPRELMNGKIFGIAFTGLTIIGTWVVFALLSAWLAPKLVGDGNDTMKLLFAVLGNLRYLTSFVFYFLGGFLLYAAMLVAIGSVCNTLKEAQNLMQPVMIVLFVPLVSMVFITQEPNGNVAKVLSFIPLFTPFTMMNRAGGPPETWEYVATTVLLLATIWFAFKAAGKVFRVGVLMTGKPPKLKEILSWLREK